jgi:hypothetical protein
LNNINNNLFIPKKLIFVLFKNNDIKQSTNNRPKNILFLLAKNKVDDIISFSINRVNDISNIIGTGEKTEEINFYNIINNTIFKTDIYFFFNKNYILIYYYKINKSII